MPLRNSKEAVDLFAALPQTGVINPGRYDEALRRRLTPIRDIGSQQSAFALSQALAGDTARRQGAFDRLSVDQRNMLAKGMSPTGKWFNPIGKNMAPTFGYGAAYKNPVSGHATHQGVDWAVPKGTPIYAPNAGTLLSYGFGKTGFGNEIRLQLGDYLGILGHLSQFAPGLKAGMQVTPGMLLGYAGATGNATGNHLHMELRDALGKAINFNNFYGW